MFTQANSLVLVLFVQVVCASNTGPSKAVSTSNVNVSNPVTVVMSDQVNLVVLAIFI